MDLRRVGILAPCEGTNDFPTYFVGNDAAGLLACWTATWRPALIAQIGQLPQVVSAYSPPLSEDGESDPWVDGLLLVPAVGQADAIEWLDSVRAGPLPPAEQAPVDTQRCIVIEGFEERSEIISAIDDALPGIARVAPESEAEFFALAYAYLQVAALSHDLHYGSVFDPTLFSQSVVAAAQAAVAGDDEAMHAGLRSCYDQLEQVRSHSYPVDIHLLEVVLVADSTIGPKLAATLANCRAANLLLPGKLADRIAETEPTTLAALQTAVREERICVMTGSYDGGELSHLPPEAMLREITRSVVAIEESVGSKPTCFAQHATSAPPRLPQLLDAIGFEGALLAGFDGAEPLPLDLGRTTWVGLDGTSLESVTGAPRDAGRPETFLGLVEALSLTLQRDHVATVLLAGWPGHAHSAANDLRLVAKRSDVLGRFVTLKEYFERAAISDHWSAVENDSLGPTSTNRPPGLNLPAAEEHSHLLQGMGDVARTISSSPAPSANDGAPSGCALELASLLKTLAATQKIDLSDNDPQVVVAFNAWSSSVPAPTSPAASIPAMGFWIAGKSHEQPESLRAEQFSLRGESLLAKIHPESGGLQSLRTHKVRRNRLSQRLFLVGRRSVTVAEMQAEGVEVVSDEPHVGAIRSYGKLLTAGGSQLASFEQTFTLPGGADFLLADIRIERTANWRPGQKLVSRFNLGGGDWRLHRGMQWTRLPVSRSNFLAGEYAELSDAAGRVSIAFEKPTRCELRGKGLLDTTLVVSDESPAVHRVALSLDTRYPLRAALGGLVGPSFTTASSLAPTPQSGWWLHCDAANVVVSHLSVPASEAAGPPRRLRVRLIETEGRSADARLRLCQPIESAWLCGFDGPRNEELSVEEGVAVVEIGPYGWLEIEASW